MPRPHLSLLPSLTFLLGGQAAAQYVTHPAIPYKTVSGVPLLMDVYEPASPGPHPLVMWIHGGAWRAGTRSLAASRIRGLAEAGIAVASIDYRLTSQGALFGADQVTFPAQIDDVQDALVFLRQNAATWSLDPARFGTWGTSAGGHLAALAGTLGDPADPRGDTSVQAVGDGYGPTAFFTMDADLATHGCVGAPPHDVPSSPESILVGFDGPGEGIGVLRDAPWLPEYALVVAANPITHVGPGDPPLLALHGETDCTVSVGQSLRLVDAYLAAGLRARLLTHPGGHALPEEFVDDFTDFFVAELGGARRIERVREDFDAAQLLPLDAQAVPADFDNETVRMADHLWGGCNMGSTTGGIPHGVQLDGHPAVSADGGSLVFAFGAVAEGSRAATRWATPVDLAGGGELSLRLTRSAGVHYRVLLRDASGWWASGELLAPAVAGPAAVQTVTLELGALPWLRVDAADPAGADLDELDDGGETGPLTLLAGGQPDLAAVAGIGLQMGAGNDPSAPFAVDRLALHVTAPAVGVTECDGLPNSTGEGARLGLVGSRDAADNDLGLVVEDLPPGAFGLLVSGRAAARTPLFDGLLCIDAPLGRHPMTLRAADAGGSLEARVDLVRMPVPTPPYVGAVVPGDTWLFQWWYRDATPGPTANFSSACAVEFL